MTRDSTSTDSLINATRSRAKFSGHGKSKGAAGFSSDDESIGEFLRKTGETAIVNPQKDGFQKIKIGAAWDNMPLKQAGFFGKILKKATKQGIDIDLGCLYELQNGKRGAIQAFGDMFGNYKKAPFIGLSRDERTGDAEGDDEYIVVNGPHWPDIKRILVYVYIYDGAPDWEAIKPKIHVNVPGEAPMVVIPGNTRDELAVCTICGLENVRNGIRIENYTEYFPGHAEMDRAFGFGLQWDDGRK